MINKQLFINREEWRAWLADHHKSESEIWLIYFKKHSGKKSISYNEAVEEALCFGWIDSKVQRIDDEKYMQRYTPRKAKSNWAASNKQRVKKLIAAGLMTPAGLEKIEIAKQNGSWNRLDEIENEITVPDDLRAALSEIPTALENFENFADSHKKQYLWWLKSAKRPDTRTKRLREIVRRARENIKPGM